MKTLIGKFVYTGTMMGDGYGRWIKPLHVLADEDLTDAYASGALGGDRVHRMIADSGDYMFIAREKDIEIALNNVRYAHEKAGMGFDPEIDLADIE